MVDALADLDPFALLDAEAQRLDGFFAGLRGEGWERPTRCEGWRARDLLAHLAGSEVYNRACLDDRLDELFATARAAGSDRLDAFNAWMVRQRAGKPVDDVLAEWRESGASNRRRLRDLGRDGTLATSAGPYPAGAQAFHLAVEAATHADDLGAPVDGGERESRTGWLARVARWSLSHEREDGPRLRPVDGGVEVGTDGERARLSDAELVAAATARLPHDHPLSPALREALRAFA
ncbi:MAG: maleylpyruvate isomerase family mycothiol-dependent enzyme [Euzebyales bacterium]|nr:maleylpyruvate isomerase family mycothiol-dependent enzyme [Euzebyales bacterium]